MGQIQRFTDATGEMSMLDRHDEDIAQIVEEINRVEDQLDALNRSVKILARDTRTITYSGGSSYTPGSYTYGSGTVGTFMCFVEAADDPGRLYAVPYYRSIESGGIKFTLTAEALAENSRILLRGLVDTAFIPSPPSLTFHFFIIEQPANSTS